MKKNDVMDGLSPDVKEKVTKNLVYVGLIGIVMVFAGLSSAYYVSMGDSFWVKFDLPIAFWISTFVILLGSFFFYLAIRSMKNGNTARAKYLILATTLSGIVFGATQFWGYNQLVDKGAYVVNNILVSNGRYGDYFEIKMNDALLIVDGNDYKKKGEVLTKNEYQELRNFALNFTSSDSTKNLNIADYGSKFSLTYRAEPLALVEGKLMHSNGELLKRADWIRLQEMMLHVAEGRGDFFIKGKIGKDFKLLYHSEEIHYDNRKLYYKGAPLNRGLEVKLIDSRDNATAYLYIITALHLAHVVFMIFYLFLFTRRVFNDEFSPQNTLGMRATAIFWHFLGALWLYLLLFLLFIH
jgi:cytochrome c oxidase subunit III